MATPPNNEQPQNPVLLVLELGDIFVAPPAGPRLHHRVNPLAPAAVLRLAHYGFRVAVWTTVTKAHLLDEIDALHDWILPPAAWASSAASAAAEDLAAAGQIVFAAEPRSEADHRLRLAFAWTLEHCYRVPGAVSSDSEHRRTGRPLLLKNLRTLLSRRTDAHGSRVVFVDHRAESLRRNPPENCVLLPRFQIKRSSDEKNPLASSGFFADAFLRALASAADVRPLILQSGFGAAASLRALGPVRLSSPLFVSKDKALRTGPSAGELLREQALSPSPTTATIVLLLAHRAGHPLIGALPLDLIRYFIFRHLGGGNAPRKCAVCRVPTRRLSGAMPGCAPVPYCGQCMESYTLVRGERLVNHARRGFPLPPRLCCFCLKISYSLLGITATSVSRFTWCGCRTCRRCGGAICAEKYFGDILLRCKCKNRPCDFCGEQSSTRRILYPYPCHQTSSTSAPIGRDSSVVCPYCKERRFSCAGSVLFTTRQGLGRTLISTARHYFVPAPVYDNSSG